MLGAIFTQGGRILYLSDPSSLPRISQIISDYILPSSSEQPHFTYSLVNDLSLVLLVAYDLLVPRSLLDLLLASLEAYARANNFAFDWNTLEAQATAQVAHKLVPNKGATSKNVPAKGRRWEDAPVTAADAAKLDFSKNSEFIQTVTIDLGKSEVDQEIEAKKTSVGNLFSKLIFFGSKKIEAADLTDVIATLRDRLISKNVAPEISDQICETVKEALIGTKTESFVSVAETARAALEKVLTRCLAKTIDLQFLASGKKGDVFSVTFLGVNGVGKSSSLAKIAYLFKSHGYKVLIAACDTFRAGAVEQLKTHGRNLDVPVFEKGYGKDAAEIARQAKIYAKQNNFDVLLIDTAGRMQDNDPLMRSIGKLIAVNEPDVVLFVGEALVGNDAIDQIGKFDRYIREAGTRGIDGIILTKFDTVDDKVGAAISMVHKTGVPVLFVGTGQNYTNLRKLNINMVVNALLAD
jgi:signal recognition particle receptor subunit alpha